MREMADTAGQGVPVAASEGGMESGSMTSANAGTDAVSTEDEARLALADCVT